VDIQVRDLEVNILHTIKAKNYFPSILLNIYHLEKYFKYKLQTKSVLHDEPYIS
jgi:hypothetical protein